jgi:UPF0288 family protein (methanogenesis marker protein 3)
VEYDLYDKESREDKLSKLSKIVINEELQRKLNVSDLETKLSDLERIIV